MAEVDWFPTGENFEEGVEILHGERIYCIDRESLFRAGAYSIISAAESRRDVRSTYDLLLGNEIDTPQAVRETGSGRIAKMIRNGDGRKITYYRQKARRIYKFAGEWMTSDLPEQIMDDVRSGFNRREELREKIIDGFTGMGPKSGSYFQLKSGYEDAIPLDTWESRFLDEVSNIDIRMPNYVDKGGLNKEDYYRLEEEFSKVLENFRENNPELDKKYEITPSLFHCALLSKHSI